MDLRIGHRIEAGRRSESHIFIKSVIKMIKKKTCYSIYDKVHCIMKNISQIETPVSYYLK
jgi:hypothetical protein